MTRRFVHPDMKDVALESVLHALGDPVRLHLVRKLSGCPSAMNCAEVANDLEKLPLSTRHHHLRILREAGLIWSERQGVSVLNKLRKDEIEKRFPGLLHTLLPLK